jgi:hypothetical protein
MSWSECFNLFAVADHYRSIVLGLNCQLALVDAGARLFQRFAVVLAVCSLRLQPTPLFHDVFSHPIFETLVLRSRLWSAGNLKGGPQ